MKRQVSIIFCFSLPSDLAYEMRGWPEFVKGRDYSVELASSESGERVSVRRAEGEEERYVSVVGSGVGLLFDSVLGRVIYALAAQSDNLMVDCVA
jgi:hypothetical protein